MATLAGVWPQTRVTLLDPRVASPGGDTGICCLDKTASSASVSTNQAAPPGPGTHQHRWLPGPDTQGVGVVPGRCGQGRGEEGVKLQAQGAVCVTVRARESKTWKDRKWSGVTVYKRGQDCRGTGSGTWQRLNFVLNARGRVVSPVLGACLSLPRGRGVGGDTPRGRDELGRGGHGPRVRPLA